MKIELRSSVQCSVFSVQYKIVLKKYMRFQDLLAYKKGFEVAMEVFEVSKSFPKEETYSLTDQIRRSSRSVTVTITVSYR